MGILILGSICAVGEGFLIYFLVQLARDARRESERLRETAKTDSRAPQFASFEIAPPAEKAVWSEGRWQHLDSPGDAIPGLEHQNYCRAARRA